MKCKLICLVLYAAALTAMLLTDNRAIQTVRGFSSGPPGGRTGAPDELLCTQCHQAPLNDGSGTFTIIAPESYLPGETYQITVVHATEDFERHKWGFELTALSSANAKAGDLHVTDKTTQVLDNDGPFFDRQYIEHTFNGTFEGQTGGAEWAFKWTAPSSDVGPVTFYAAGNQANGDGTNEGDKIFTAQATSCANSLSSYGGLFPARDGAGEVNLTALGGCAWTVSTSDAWIVITSAESGAGSEPITFELRENSAPSARSGTISIAGLAFTVVQAGAGEGCSYSISPTGRSFASTGGQATIDVTASADCAWQAVSNVGWITIDAGSPGIGSGAVTYLVAPNPGNTRAGKITIAGKTLAIKQGHP
jgi:Viral BACON domain